MSFPYEILLEVVCNNSFDDLLSFRLGCKHFECLVSGCRDVWLNSLAELPPSKTPCLIPGRAMSTYSTDELKGVYLDALRRWKGLYSSSEIVASDWTSVVWKNAWVFVSYAWIVPGGEYLVCVTSDPFPGLLTCYDLKSSQWTFELQLDFDVEDAGFGLNRQGEAMVGLLGYAHEDADNFDVLFQTHRLRLESMTSDIVLKKTIHSEVRLETKRLEIKRDYAQVLLEDINTTIHLMFLFKWTTGECIEIDTEGVGMYNELYDWFSGMHVHDENLIYISDPVALNSVPIERFNGNWSRSSSSTDWKKVVPIPHPTCTFSIPNMERSLLRNFSSHPAHQYPGATSSLIYLALDTWDSLVFLEIQTQLNPHGLLFKLDRRLEFKLPFDENGAFVRPCLRNGTTVFHDEEQKTYFFRAFAVPGSQPFVPIHLAHYPVELLDIDGYSGAVLSREEFQLVVHHFNGDENDLDS